MARNSRIVLITRDVRRCGLGAASVTGSWSNGRPLHSSGDFPLR